MLVKKVEKDSPGDKAGIKAGDVIVGIGKETVEDLHDITSALTDFKQGDKAELSIIRKGTEMKIPVEIIIDSTCCGDMKNIFFRGGDCGDIEINMKELGEGLKMIRPYIHSMMKNFKIKGLENDCQHIQIEMEKMRPEIEKMAKEIQIKVKDINLDELKNELEKMKPELEKMKKELQENIVIMRCI
jgi:membrane-associated protease RseP (regulator of RpoE activity)